MNRNSARGIRLLRIRTHRLAELEAISSADGAISFNRGGTIIEGDWARIPVSADVAHSIAVRRQQLNLASDDAVVAVIIDAWRARNRREGA